MRLALIAFGNEESYGLLFVGGELLSLGVTIRFFDAEEDYVITDVVDWRPDFIMFSPMTTFYSRALHIARGIKSYIDATSVFGGHHAMAKPSIIDDEGVDVVVVGPARGAVSRVLDGEIGVIQSTPTVPTDLPRPARYEYYKDIPRMAFRYRKVMLSKLGCPWNCSYCSSACGHVRKIFGNEAHKRYYLGRRDLDDVMEEALVVKGYDTEEIEWVDDDMLAGSDAEEWIPTFVGLWTSYINLPMYVSATSISVLRASDKCLKELRKVANVVGLGIQAIRPSSLKLFNRQWDSFEKMKVAYDRLTSFGFSVNLQAIVGLPIKDPVEDALDTIKAMQKIGNGSICSVYPLMIYPNTKMEEYCHERVVLRDECNGDTNSATTAIKFSNKITKQLKNICKLGTLFVKFNIDENWMRALINVDFDDETSKQLSMVRYHDCVVDRLGKDGEDVYDDILATTKLRY